MKKTLFFVSIILIISFLFSVNFEEFNKLLIDIPDWKAEEPVGGRINIERVYTLRIEKSYSNGEKSFKIILLGGPGVSALWKPYSLNLSYDRDVAWRKTEEISGFNFGIYYNKNKKEGEIILPFKNKENIFGALIMEFKKIHYKKALTLFKKFDWKVMEEKVLKDMESTKEKSKNKKQ